MCHKILVPLDGSEQAELALPLVVERARIYTAEITSLRVVECLFEMYSRCHPNDNPGQCSLPVSTPVVTGMTCSPHLSLFTRCNAW